VGPNKLKEEDQLTTTDILVDQFKSAVVWLLLIAGAVAFIFGHTLEAIAILVVLVLNTTIGFFTEYGAIRSMEALKEMSQIEAQILRDEETATIPAEQLVPGDIVLLEQGTLIPADLRLLESRNLQVDESSLTGESVPVDKSPRPIPEETPLAERSSMTYKGNAITRGSGRGIVVRTGMETELGDIASLVQTTEGGQTPLDTQLDRLGQRLVWLTLLIASIVTGAGLLAGRDLFMMIETGIALAVAAIPEGLPIVATVALSYGLWQMKKRHALIRQITSVETLGATTLILTDKTGTLTENRMSVRKLCYDESVATVSEKRDAGGTHLEVDGKRVDIREDSTLEKALHTAVLANSASSRDLEEDTGEEGADPMEVALLEAGEDLGLSQDRLLEEYPCEQLVPFEQANKMMATFHRSGEQLFVAVKGAPEAVLESCSRNYDGRPVNKSVRQKWQEKNNQLADEGLRVLALATKTFSDLESPPFSELQWLGLIGLLDPPRADIRDSIARCQSAGIRVVMVTGDHPSTAYNVAEAVGLTETEEAVTTNPTLDKLAPETILSDFLQTDVFARVKPEDKLRILELYQSSGGTVAMTGDGVNDAPALESADIGIAMGERGTEVAQEASDMILLDDAFSSIVTAIQQGRVIFNNIRRFVIYLLSGNVGEILAVGGASVVGAPLPLLPLQILYLNILNDVFPALALAVTPGSGEEMEQPPQRTEKSIVEAEHWSEIGGYGVVIAATVSGAFALALGPMDFSTSRAVSVSFLTLSASRLIHVFNMRSPQAGIFANPVASNPWVWTALGLDAVLLLFAVYFEPLSRLLSVEPPGTIGWVIIGAATLITLAIGQIYLALRPGSQT
jgi:Ca2+-transporting ATPase